VLLRVGELVPGGVSLVLPDVAPLVRRHAVAEPLVGELMEHHRVPHATRIVGEPGGVVERQRLGLEREAERGVDDQRAVEVEWVGPHPFTHPPQLVLLDRQLGGVLGHQAGGDDVSHLDPVDAPSRHHRELADGELRELGRHRLALRVGPYGPAAVPVVGDQHTVGDRRRAGRDVEPEREARLVPRVVVGGVDAVHRVGRPRRRRAVGGDEERCGQELVGVGDRRVGPEVTDLHLEERVVADRVRRRDNQFLIAAGEARRSPVDGDAADAGPAEVEVEAGQRLGSPAPTWSRSRRCPARAPWWRSAGQGRSAGRRSRRCQGWGRAGHPDRAPQG